MLSRDEVLENIQDGFIQYIPREYENDKEIVLVIVSKFGLELHNASFQLRADKEVVLAAVEQNGLALMYADDVLRSQYPLNCHSTSTCCVLLSLFCMAIRYLCIT